MSQNGMRQVGDLFTANGILGLVAHAILIPTGASAQGVPSVPRQPPVTPQMCRSFLAIAW